MPPGDRRQDRSAHADQAAALVRNVALEPFRWLMPQAFSSEVEPPPPTRSVFGARRPYPAPGQHPMGPGGVTGGPTEPAAADVELRGRIPWEMPQQRVAPPDNPGFDAQELTPMARARLAQMMAGPPMGPTGASSAVGEATRPRVGEVSTIREAPLGAFAREFDRPREAKSARRATASEIVAHVARITGAPAEFLQHLVVQESGGDHEARPIDPVTGRQRSSAHGLGQFTDRTWLDTMRAHGPRLGLQGRERDEDLLALRADPRWSVAMTAVYAQQNAGILGGALGRAPTEGEVYLGHFLGPEQAARLIEGARKGGHDARRYVSAGAVEANPEVFFRPDGKARSAQEVVQLQTRRFRPDPWPTPTPPARARGSGHHE